MPRTPMITVEVRESAYSLLAAIASDQDVQLKGATFNRENGKWRIQLETDVFVALCRYAPREGPAVKLYRVSCQSSSMGRMLAWASSKREARKEATALRRTLANAEDLNSPPEIDEVEIPTDRRGLVRWLNAHFDTDNG